MKDTSKEKNIKEQPYYSLIIPHYNIPKLLRRLLRTVPKRDDLQVIVVDDCSTKELDELLKVKDEYPWVEWYDTGTNGGGGKARNIGLRHALGTYVLFADSDDYFTPGIDDILAQVYWGNSDLVIFKATSVNNESYELSNRALELNDAIKHYEADKENGELKLRYNFGEPWCKFIKREVIDVNQIKFDETPCHNDTHFSYLIGFHCKSLKVIPMVGYVVTFRHDSVIHMQLSHRDSIVFDIFKKKEEFFIDNNIPLASDNLYNLLVAYIVKRKWREFKSFIHILKLTIPRSRIYYGIWERTRKILAYKIKQRFIR